MVGLGGSGFLSSLLDFFQHFFGKMDSRAFLLESQHRRDLAGLRNSSQKVAAE